MELEAEQATKAKTALKRYLAALTTAEQKAQRSGKQDVVRAITAEKEVTAVGMRMAPNGPPALPPELSSPRITFVREMDRIIKSGAAEAKALSSAYLKTLAALETRAAREPATLEEIAAEKRHSESVGDGERFLRVTHRSYIQKVPIPFGAKIFTISGGMRSGDFVPSPTGSNRAMDIAALCHRQWVSTMMVKGGSSTWRKLERVKNVPADGKELEVHFTRWDVITATIGYDDIELTFR